MEIFFSRFWICKRRAVWITNKYKIEKLLIIKPICSLFRSHSRYRSISLNNYSKKTINLIARSHKHEHRINKHIFIHFIRFKQFSSFYQVILSFSVRLSVCLFVCCVALVSYVLALVSPLIHLFFWVLSICCECVFFVVGLFQFTSCTSAKVCK